MDPDIVAALIQIKKGKNNKRTANSVLNGVIDSETEHFTLLVPPPTPGSSAKPATAAAGATAMLITSFIQELVRRASEAADLGAGIVGGPEPGAAPTVLEGAHVEQVLTQTLLDFAS